MQLDKLTTHYSWLSGCFVWFYNAREHKNFVKEKGREQSVERTLPSRKKTERKRALHLQVRFYGCMLVVIIWPGRTTFVRSLLVVRYNFIQEKGSLLSFLYRCCCCFVFRNPVRSCSRQERFKSVGKCFEKLKFFSVSQWVLLINVLHVCPFSEVRPSVHSPNQIKCLLLLERKN